VHYSKPGCLAYYDNSDGTLKIQVTDDNGHLTVICGKKAHHEWGDFCDIYINAPNTSIKTIKLKGRRRTQIHVCGEVYSVKKFKLKYGSVGDTQYYGEERSSALATRRSSPRRRYRYSGAGRQRRCLASPTRAPPK